jgi:CHAD domain-containing protein
VALATLATVVRSDEALTDAMSHELEALARELAADLRGARKAKAGGVHHTRTGLRRIRGAVEFMGRTLWAPEAARRLGRRLHRTEKSLSKVRDAEVMLDVLDGYFRSHRRDRDALESVVRTLRRRRHRAASRAADVGRKLPRRIRRFARDSHPVIEAAPRCTPALVREFAREEVWRRYDAVRAYQAHPPRDPEAIHKYRSACRDLRFCLESFAGAFPRLEPLAERLHALQGKLGDMHDRHVAAALVGRWLAKGKIPRTRAAESLARWAISERDRLRHQTRTQRLALFGRGFRVHLSRALEVERGHRAGA